MDSPDVQVSIAAHDPETETTRMFSSPDDVPDGWKLGSYDPHREADSRSLHPLVAAALAAFGSYLLLRGTGGEDA
jgi:hypothetical protein